MDVSLWEAVLPPEVLRLPEELARVDALLDDPVFFAPFVPFFDPRVGRPSTPMEVYLRMFLNWLNAPRPTPNGCCATPGSRCAGHRPRPKRWPRPVGAMLPPVDAAGGCAGRSMT